MRRFKRHRSPQGAAASRRALGKYLCQMSAIAKQRRWRTPRESLIIRSLIWAWCQQLPEERCSARKLAKQLGCDHMWVLRLKWQFGTSAGAARQERAERTWGPCTLEQLREEQAKRKDDHGVRYRVPRIKRPTIRPNPMRDELERRVKDFLEAHKNRVRHYGHL